MSPKQTAHRQSTSQPEDSTGKEFVATKKAVGATRQPVIEISTALSLSPECSPTCSALQQDAAAPAEISVRQTPQRRAYRKRSIKAVSAAEQESRKQRRLEKNRITAASSRVRRREQFTEMQVKVTGLEKSNKELILELSCREKELKAVKDKLANLSAVEDGSAFAQQDPKIAAYKDEIVHKHSAAKAVRESSSCADLIDVPRRLQSDAFLPQCHLQDPDFELGKMTGCGPFREKPDSRSNSFNTQTVSPPQKQGANANMQETIDQQPEQIHKASYGNRMRQYYQLKALLEFDSGGPVISLEQHAQPLNLNHHNSAEFTRDTIYGDLTDAMHPLSSRAKIAPRT